MPNNLTSKEVSIIKNEILEDEKIFANTQASSEFWENNPIIKRTPLNDEVIKDLTKKKKKSDSIFQNTK